MGNNFIGNFEPNYLLTHSRDNDASARYIIDHTVIIDTTFSYVGLGFSIINADLATVDNVSSPKQNVPNTTVSINRH